MNPRILSVASVAGCDSAQNGTPTSARQAQHADHIIKDEQQVSLAKLVPKKPTLGGSSKLLRSDIGTVWLEGPPLKVSINDKPVFVCGKGCE